ncbi:hypothetical protein [uncultured Bradyrhizobium sp.]|jgi:hypothetical protein|uniref:hypothetical protein n=1 Tax=uncultured Bradyrhizobium sp. TaxID=199684 RepID=UPI0026270BA8|nr:hypothetical protein [uncultured Bradyrhizobium sp.]
MIPQGIREGLFEIAEETGRPYAAVERIFLLCVDAPESDVSFLMTDGGLMAVSQESYGVPQHLIDATNAVYDDLEAMAEKMALMAIRPAGRTIQ